MDIGHNLCVNVFLRAENYPERLAFSSLERSLTYRQLQERVLQAAAAFRENGINARSCVALDTRTSLTSLTATLALALLGCKWVFASREAVGNPLLFITHLVQDEPRNRPHRYERVNMDETWYSGRVFESSLAHPSFAGPLEPERILVIGQSSGTTGEPKFFPITAENARKRADPKYLLDPTPIPVVASLFHVLHAAIFFGLLRVFAKGGTLVFGINKAHWQEAGVTLVLASPMHAAQIFEGRAGPARGKIPRLWVTGSPIYPAFLDQALDHFDEVVNSYGSIEASVVCHQVIKNRVAEGDIVGVGSAMYDHVLEVVDESGLSVKPGAVGEVRYQSPLLTTGYIGDSTATKTFFRDGWFYPGDIGYLDSKKQLFITGRINDLLNIGGTKLNAATVDGVILSVPEIADGTCFSEPGPSGFEQLSVVAVPKDGEDHSKMASGLLKGLAKRFARDLIPRSVYIAEAIPRNENGKVLRNMVREKAQSGVWRQVTLEKEQP